MTVTPDSNLLWQEATSHFDAQRFYGAETCCYQLIACGAGHPLAHAMLSQLFHMRGRRHAAAFHAIEACKMATRSHWRDILWISAAMLALGDSRLAQEVLSFIDPHDTANHDCLTHLGLQYSKLGDKARAHHCLDLATADVACSGTMRVPVHT
jgi:predicted Zn-dependent protease